jgi:hypothetical protein
MCSVATDDDLFDDPQPVPEETIVRAIELLSAVTSFAAPTEVGCGADGSIGILWKNSGFRVLINVNPGGMNTFFAQSANERIVVEMSIPELIAELRARFVPVLPDYVMQISPTFQPTNEMYVRVDGRNNSTLHAYVPQAPRLIDLIAV